MESSMTAALAPIGDTAWFLVGMPDGSGQCDHCGRNLKHLYRVVNPDGAELTVGRGCVKRITGWTSSYAQAKQALCAAERGVELARRREIAGAQYPELAAAEKAVQDACRQAAADGFEPLSGYARVSAETRRHAAIFTTAVTEDHLWRNGDWASYVDRNTVRR